MARYAELGDEAIAEFNEQVDWYQARSTDAALGFIDAISEALERIVAAPGRYPGTFAGCRHCRLPRYPLQIVFLEEGDRLLVVAIAHSKREPGYWQNRLPPNS
jgi:plasmid stabilization system protein ParE